MTTTARALSPLALWRWWWAAPYQLNRHTLFEVVKYNYLMPGDLPIDRIDRIAYIADDAGRRRAAIVPIDLWREIASDIETRRLLDHPTMRRRLREAMHRPDSIPLAQVLTRLNLDPADPDLEGPEQAPVAAR